MLTATFLNFGQDEEDRSILKRIAKGEETALSELFDRYGQLLYNLSMRILSSVSDAEDIVQDVFTQVWNSTSMYDQDKRSVYSQLVKMTHDRGIDRLRSMGVKPHGQLIETNKLTLIADSQSSNVPLSIMQREQYEFIVKALKRLSSEQQQVLVLAYYEGLTKSAITRKLNVPLETVKSRLREGLSVLRTALQQKR